jgi:hypothetical protein
VYLWGLLRNRRGLRGFGAREKIERKVSGKSKRKISLDIRFQLPVMFSPLQKACLTHCGCAFHICKKLNFCEEKIDEISLRPSVPPVCFILPGRVYNQHIRKIPGPGTGG